MKIIYLGTPYYAIYPLERLLENPSHEVVAVITQVSKGTGRGRKLTEPPLAKFAKEKKIKLFQPVKASDQNFLKEIKDLNADLCITCAYGQILTESFLSIPKRGTINIHPSLLPLYRGAVPVPAAILAGDTITGVSILFTVKELDAGNIIIQKRFPIHKMDNSKTLLEKLFFESAELLEKAIFKLEDPEFIGIKQDPYKVVHCKKIEKSHGQINWDHDLNKIYNSYRAFLPWPGTFTYFKNKRILIEEMIIINHYPEYSSLTHKHFTYDKEKKLLIVKVHDDLLGIKSLKIEGKKSMSSEDFWNGHQLKKEEASKLKFD